MLCKMCAQEFDGEKETSAGFGVSWTEICGLNSPETALQSICSASL